MEALVQSPSHVCQHCGDWWIVEPLRQDKWMVSRYVDRTEIWKETALDPVCPDCRQVVLTRWVIDPAH